MSIRRIFWLAALIICAGCWREEVAKPADDAVINVLTADAKFELVKIGNRAISCGDFRERLDFECALWKLLHPRAHDVEKELGLYRARRMEKILPELINQVGLSVWADGKGIRLTEDESRTASRNALNALGFKGGEVQFSKKIGRTTAYVSRQLCASALSDKIRADFDPASTNLTEKEIDDGLARLSAYYQRAIASNAVTWVTCSNVMGQINKGLSFDQAARLYAYNSVEDGKKWGDFLPAEILDEKLKAWAYSAPVGTMKVFELDDGISIVRILARQDGTVEPSIVSKGEAEVSLARINFAMVEPEPEPRTREHVRTALLKWKADGVQKRLFTEIFEKYPLSYPNGAVKIGF